MLRVCTYDAFSAKKKKNYQNNDLDNITRTNGILTNLDDI